jgi:NADPH-dependent 2,4-dienoyl-CoA reductase/sulfur reductase-like enzyme
VVDNVERLIAKKPEELHEEQKITVKTGYAVEEIDLEKARIRVRQNGDARDWWEPFDLLMIATGALPIRPPIDGIDAKGIFGINTLQSGLDLMAYLEERQPKKALVIGGGYIGLEMAENLLLRGMDVSLVERGPEVMGTPGYRYGHKGLRGADANGCPSIQERKPRGI